MKAILAIVSVLIATSAQADATYCYTVSELAAKIMRNRQAGVPASKMYEAFGKGLTRSLVVAAYNRPRFTHEEFINESIETFRDDIYIACIGEVSKLDARK